MKAVATDGYRFASSKKALEERNEGISATVPSRSLNELSKLLSNSENTIPTEHERIRVAKVREYEYADAKELVDQLTVLSKAVNIPDMIRLMKKNVPEYISKNSKFEQYDAHKAE